MTFEYWYILFGLLLGTLAFIRHISENSPITPAMIYFVIGVILGPTFTGLVRVDIFEHGTLLERITEFVVIVSVFAAAMKLKLKNNLKSVEPILRLALVAMVITVVLTMVTSMALLQFNVGMALLLGAVLAPTDPVLASTVQVNNKDDKDMLRQTLTGEAGVNDSTAFPFIYLALGLLGYHKIGAYAGKWFVVDVVLAIGGAIAIGFACGYLSAKGLRAARKAGWETMVLDEFIAVGLMAVSYGIAMAAHTYGFISVFVAGMTFRWLFESEMQKSPKGKDETNLDGMIKFHDQLERFGEVFTVIILGIIVGSMNYSWNAIVFAIILFFIVRPISVYAGLWRSKVTRRQTRLSAWLGIRGIGSLYYLTYSINNGLPETQAEALMSAAVTVLTLSLFFHGVTANWLMRVYSAKESASG